MDYKTEYASGVKDVLIRKINKAEKHLHTLKLDYCRFVFGLSHRSRVIHKDKVYHVRSVDLDHMQRTVDGHWSKPAVRGVPCSDSLGRSDDFIQVQDEFVDLGQHWEIFHGKL